MVECQAGGISRIRDPISDLRRGVVLTLKRRTIKQHSN